VFVRAKAVLLGTGGGPTMYKYHTPSGEKSCDGLAMALRAGLPLRDMEMVQFHPTGLYAGTHTRMTGTVLEEGLRGSGGYLLNGAKERFMPKYDPRAERATRDFVSRAMYAEMRAGRTSPNGGLYISMSHLDKGMVEKEFRGMIDRCADCGFDLVGGLVEVVPTAHYMMGGVEFKADCSTVLHGLFVAGEDAGGVHGANRLGGNGVANSTVFGAVAGDTMAEWVRKEAVLQEPDKGALDIAVQRCEPGIAKKHGGLEPLRERLYEVMWEKVGIIRDAGSLRSGLSELAAIEGELNACGIADANRAFNLGWHDWLNLKNLLETSRVIAHAALARADSRGAHYREDFPETGSLEDSRYTSVRMENSELKLDAKPVAFTRVRPGESLLVRDL
jgi:fumarate reductase flavoprotein subunit